VPSLRTILKVVVSLIPPPTLFGVGVKVTALKAVWTLLIDPRPVLKVERVPFAGVSRAMAKERLSPSKSLSCMLEKGLIVEVSLVVWFEVSPKSVGASLIPVMRTVVVEFTSEEAVPSFTCMLKVVVSVCPPLRAFAVGVKVMARRAV